MRDELESSRTCSISIQSRKITHRGYEYNLESGMGINSKPHQIGLRGLSMDCWCGLSLPSLPWKPKLRLISGPSWEGPERENQGK